MAGNVSPDPKLHSAVRFYAFPDPDGRVSGVGEGPRPESSDSSPPYMEHIGREQLSGVTMRRCGKGLKAR